MGMTQRWAGRLAGSICVGVLTLASASASADLICELLSDDNVFTQQVPECRRKPQNVTVTYKNL